MDTKLDLNSKISPDSINWRPISEKPFAPLDYHVLLDDGTIDKDGWDGEMFHFYGDSVVKWMFKY